MNRKPDTRSMPVLVGRRFFPRPLFIILSLLFLLALLMSASLVSAARARDSTLRSRLYEHFRCGNGICEAVETSASCPEDCAANETLPSPPEPPAPSAASQPASPSSFAPPAASSSAGFERISGVVPAEEFFERSASRTPGSASSSAFSSFVSSFLPLLVFIVLVAGISLFYYLRRLHRMRARFLQPPVRPVIASSAAAQSAAAPFAASSSSSDASILSTLISQLRKKGLSLPEIQARVQRMGIWDEEAIKVHLQLS